MALITCPECQQQISDQAGSCPHCGFPLTQQTPNECADCVQNELPSTPENENMPIKPPRKKLTKRFAVVSVVVVVVIAVLAAVFAFISSEKARRDAEQEALELRAAYIDNLKAISLQALTGAAEAERVCNLTKSVWYDTIYEEYDAETAEYTRTNGKFNEDFNTSLSKLYASDGIIDSVAKLKANQSTVEDLYKKLLEPTPEFENCFEEVEELYSAYYNFTKLAISPSGSLKTYSNDFSEYDSDFMEHYDKLMMLIPND